MNAELRGLAYWMRQRSDEEKRDGEEVEAAIYRECAGKLEAALSVAQGQGFVMVPRVPTEAILDVLFERMDETDEQLTEAWSRILSVAAAPAQPDGVE